MMLASLHPPTTTATGASFSAAPAFTFFQKRDLKACCADMASLPAAAAAATLHMGPAGRALVAASAAPLCAWGRQGARPWQPAQRRTRRRARAGGRRRWRRRRARRRPRHPGSPYADAARPRCSARSPSAGRAPRSRGCAWPPARARIEHVGIGFGHTLQLPACTG